MQGAERRLTNGRCHWTSFWDIWKEPLRMVEYCETGLFSMKTHLLYHMFQSLDNFSSERSLYAYVYERFYEFLSGGSQRNPFMT